MTERCVRRVTVTHWPTLWPSPFPWKQVKVICAHLQGKNSSLVKTKRRDFAGARAKVSLYLTLRKIAIWMSKNCKKKKNGKKSQVFGNFLTFKWQFFGGSGLYPLLSDSHFVLIEQFLDCHNSSNLNFTNYHQWFIIQ